MPRDRYLLVLCAFPNAEEARQVGTRLVELQVAACVNLVPGAASIYRWKGEIQTAEETLALIKTTEANYRELESRIQELHPYEVPEIIALPVETGSSAYLGWISESTRD